MDETIADPPPAYDFNSTFPVGLLPKSAYSGLQVESAEMLADSQAGWDVEMGKDGGKGGEGEKGLCCCRQMAVAPRRQRRYLFRRNVESPAEQAANARAATFQEERDRALERVQTAEARAEAIQEERGRLIDVFDRAMEGQIRAAARADKRAEAADARARAVAAEARAEELDRALNREAEARTTVVARTREESDRAFEVIAATTVELTAAVQELRELTLARVPTTERDSCSDKATVRESGQQ